MNKLIRTIKLAVTDFLEDECMVSGAALAYYTIFSLPPLLVLVFLVAGAFNLPQEKIDRVVRRQIGIPLSGPAIGDNDQRASSEQQSDTAASTTLESIAQRGSSQLSPIESLGWLSKIVGGLILVFSASGVFAQLQAALNRAWDVTPDPDQGGIKNFLVKRGLSFGMIVVIAFLLLVSLVLTTVVDELIDWVVGRDSQAIATAVGYIFNDAIALAVATALFAVMYKVLPDAQMRWKDIWAGAFITALLFIIGKTVLGLYLERSQVGTAWGSAAASMITLLVWVYYSSLIVLFGAELTQAWAANYGAGIQPEQGAVRASEADEKVRRRSPSAARLPRHTATS